MKNYYDKYYQDVLENLGSQYLRPTGWLNYDPKELINKGSTEYLSINSTFLDTTVSTSEPMWVVLSTGSYHPLHEGHIELLQKTAQVVASKTGVSPLIVLSPSNKAYLKIKLGEKLQNDELRKHTILEAVSNLNILVDFWELNQNRDVNFTDVIEHVQEMFSKIFKKEKELIHIVYAFGSDNVDFCHVFNTRGFCACGSRKEVDPKYFEIKEKYANSGRHLFLDQMASQKISSSSCFKNLISIPSSRAGSYCIRDDSWWYQTWIDKAKLNRFKKSLVSLFLEVIPKENPVVLLDTKPQLEFVTRKTALNACLNLDVISSLCTNAAKSKNLSITRLFGVNDGQFQALRLIKRPEDSGFKVKDAFEDLFEGIAPGEYSYIDDDISSGFTLCAIRKAGELKGIQVKEAISLLNAVYPGIHVADVVDLRDFLPTYKNLPYAGLTVWSPERSLHRLSYIDSKIDLFSRASIPFEVQAFFRTECLRLQKKL